MSDAAIQRVGVVGAGQMGSGIAEVSVRADVDVTVFETTEALIAAGRNRIVKSLERGVSAGKVTERERDRALSKLTFTTDLNDLADRQLVIEAIIEDDAVKAQVFAELDRVITDPDAVLASNTSSIPIMKIAAATKNPQRVLGLHFFNPVPVLPLVELVSTLVTDEAAAAHRGVRERGPGQAGSALLGPVRLRGERVAGALPALGDPHGGGRICHGRGCGQGCGGRAVAPDGPAAPVRPGRPDTLKLIADKMFEEFKEPQYGPPPLLLRMVEAGRLGKKTGQGFYKY